jgi:hypothetical protein
MSGGCTHPPEFSHIFQGRLKCHAPGAEIWHKVGSPPAGPADCTFLATTTRSTHLAEYDDGDGGKSVYYITRWINSRGETGPWSDTVAATIAA